MSVSPITSYKFNTNYQSYATPIQNQNLKLQNDAFIKTQPVFKSTSAGKPLKKLFNVHDCVFDIKLLNDAEWAPIEKYIDTNPGAKKTIKFLQQYKENMLKVETSILNSIAKVIKENPNFEFQDCLKMWYDKALIGLKLEEFDVLDKIDKMSKSLTPETMLEVRRQVTHCRQVILDNDPMHPFKRKTVLGSLDEIQPLSGEEDTLFELKELAKDLPTSGTSENAFIVKYANRGQNEIAKRFLRMSRLTVDHTFADSLGGENAMYNFDAMSALANSLKGNDSLYRFVLRFPCAKENYKKNMSDIIGIINNGGLRGNETYPYKHAEWLKEHSKGLINVKSEWIKYKYSKKEAQEMEEKYRTAMQNKRKAYLA